MSPSDEKPAASGRFDLNDLTAVLRPAAYPHVGKLTSDACVPLLKGRIDQSPSAVISRTRLQLGDEAEMLLRGRVRVIKLVLLFDSYLSNQPMSCHHPNVDFPLFKAHGGQSRILSRIGPWAYVTDPLWPKRI